MYRYILFDKTKNQPGIYSLSISNVSNPLLNDVKSIFLLTFYEIKLITIQQIFYKINKIFNKYCGKFLLLMGTPI